LYADQQTQSIKRAIEVTRYRRIFQKRYNEKHDITPRTIVKGVAESEHTIKGTKHLPKSEIQKQLIELDAQMRAAAERLEFEKAIQFRDRIQELEKSLDYILEKEDKTPQKRLG
jgi:excinuclease ABC subunit B